MSQPANQLSPETETYATKVCAGCRKEKTALEFYKAYQSQDGLSYYCAACNRERAKAWREANREKLRAYNKLYTKLWRAKYREHVRAYQRAQGRARRAA